jgi:hypothetical protein
LDCFPEPNAVHEQDRLFKEGILYHLQDTH